MSYTSRLPKVAIELAARMDAVAQAVANEVEAAAKERVPVDQGDLQGAIHTQREGIGEYAVIAGNTDVFYGHIVEHGSTHSGARPFMTPAAEQARPLVRAIGARALKGL